MQEVSRDMSQTGLLASSKRVRTTSLLFPANHHAHLLSLHYTSSPHLEFGHWCIPTMLWAFTGTAVDVHLVHWSGTVPEHFAPLTCTYSHLTEYTLSFRGHVLCISYSDLPDVLSLAADIRP